MKWADLLNENCAHANDLARYSEANDMTIGAIRMEQHFRSTTQCPL